MIEIENLTFGYGNEKSGFSLRGINASIHSGSFTGVIGPNGSGKSTLLKCISGYFRPDSGSVRLEGREVSGISVRELSEKMSYVGQSFHIDYDFRVEEIVQSGRNPYIRRGKKESPQDDAAVERAMLLTGILPLRDRPVSELSGGETQMMVLARALAQNAEIMLLDEPVTGLDIRHQAKFLELVSRLSLEMNLTTICVFHDLSEAYACCDQILLLREGELLHAGPPKDVLTKDRIEEAYKVPLRVFGEEDERFFFPYIRTNPID